MAFFKRAMSKQESFPVTPTTPTSAKKFPSTVEPEWKAVLDINEDAIKAWRIEGDGTPIQVKEDAIGFFLSDELYVILNVSNHNKRLIYNLHFWLGKAKADKAGTSPPEKVSQLMSILNDKVVIHRQVEGNEDPNFKALFKVFGVLSGNSAGLFKVDQPESYRPRLLHFCLTRDKSRIEVTEVPISRKSLNSGDVYIFDEGTKMTQWNGSRCDEEERMAARKYIDKALKDRKMKCTSEFFDEEDLLDNNELYRKLGSAEVPARPMKLSKKRFQKKLFRLSDESKKLVLTPVYVDKVYRNGINPDDVTFVDTHQVLFIYIGPGANENERNSVWLQSEKYLKDASTPSKSISVFNAGCFCEGFEEVWDDLRN